MEPIVLTKSHARKIILDAAGLARNAQFGSSREAVYKVIEHLGLLQLDTNYVIERAHHHALASHIPGYQVEWLSDLCEEGRLYEYFASDAGYLPMEDFRFSLPVKNAFREQRKPLTPSEVNLMHQILERIEREGPLMVTDFENDRKEISSGWWDWRPAKIALERLYLDGQLMITRDKAFHKIYDLPRNIVPQETDVTMPSAEEYARFVITCTLRTLGIASVKEMEWRARRVKGNLIKKELEKMEQEGDVHAIIVDGSKGPLYMLSAKDRDIALSNEVFILSPFDPLNVFRYRLKDFFNFDYQIECFVPAPKRIYGYFLLPILSGDTFIARMDDKADRKQETLVVHNIHFEPVEIGQAVIENFILKLKAFVDFNQCRDIAFKKTNNEKYLKTIADSF
jgi:uncharacterized protein YcaQ